MTIKIYKIENENIQTKNALKFHPESEQKNGSGLNARQGIDLCLQTWHGKEIGENNQVESRPDRRK